MTTLIDEDAEELITLEGGRGAIRTGKRCPCTLWGSNTPRCSVV